MNDLHRPILAPIFAVAAFLAGRTVVARFLAFEPFRAIQPFTGWPVGPASTFIAVAPFTTTTAATAVAPPSSILALAWRSGALIRALAFKAGAQGRLAGRDVIHQPAGFGRGGGFGGG
jgi:hypothetical protein